MPKPRIFFDTEFTDLGFGADLISIAFISGTNELYIVISDVDLSEASDFVRENVLPLLDKHSPEHLKRDQAAFRIQEWINALRSNDMTREMVLCCDSNWDWQMLLELYPFMPGQPTWASAQHVVCRLAQNELAATSRDGSFFEALEHSLGQNPERHHALVDARALSLVFQSFHQSPPLDAAAQQPEAQTINLSYSPTVLSEDDEFLASRTAMFSDGEDWRKTMIPKSKILLKHQMTGAADAVVEWSVDHDNKIIEITMVAAASQKPFLSTSLLESAILRLMPEGVIAYNDDDVDSWTPKRTPWEVFVTVGDFRMQAVFWHHRKDMSGKEQPLTIELYPFVEWHTVIEDPT
jgi:inhibitor of KinA sporulation pathway (predicted exonuclease)